MIPVQFRELWEYRELLYFLVWRTVKVRYKQTVLGIGWAVIQPVLMMIVFTVFFGSLVGINTNGVPYPIFVYSALLPWNLFAVGLTGASTALSGNENLITKVYFPRLLLPLSAVMVGLVDFSVAFTILIGLMVYYAYVPTLAVLTLPLFLLLAVMSAVGVSLWLSSLDAKYRDVRATIPYLTQLWFFATPTIYPTTYIPGAWQWLYSLNPMYGVVQGFRWALIPGQAFSPNWLTLLSVIIVIVMLIGGMFYFRRAERTLADIL